MFHFLTDVTRFLHFLQEITGTGTMNLNI